MPSIRLISLFVPSLAEATAHYSALLQVSPCSGSNSAIEVHPFASKGPVVFQLGSVALALYECDGRTTHPGDVGIGLEDTVQETAARLNAQGGTVFWGPSPIEGHERQLAIGMMPDRHFFEIIEAGQHGCALP